MKIATLKDNEGNELYRMQDGRYFLKLKGHITSRLLGNIEGDTLYIYRDSYRHTMKKLNAYGFNYHLIKNTSAKYILLSEDERDYYKIPKQEIMNNHKVLHFKDSFELQLFYNKKNLAQWKI